MLSLREIGLRRLQAVAMPLEIGRIQEIEQIQIQFPQDGVGNFDRKELLACQDIMNVGLRDTGHAGEAAFGNFTAPNFMTEAVDEPGMEVSKSKHECLIWGIPLRNRGVLNLIF